MTLPFSPSRRNFLKLASVSLGTLCLPQAAYAAKDPIYTSWGVAIKGTDPVAYFTQGRAIKGSKEFAADYQGATFYFATSAHRDLFISQPEAYAPQYGGYCAWAVSNGYTASITPEAFRIVDGKLYLNYSLRIQQQWDADRDNRIILADRNWPAVLGQ